MVVFKSTGIPSFVKMKTLSRFVFAEGYRYEDFRTSRTDVAGIPFFYPEDDFDRLTGKKKMPPAVPDKRREVFCAPVAPPFPPAKTKTAPKGGSRFGVPGENARNCVPRPSDRLRRRSLRSPNSTLCSAVSSLHAGQNKNRPEGRFSFWCPRRESNSQPQV